MSWAVIPTPQLVYEALKSPNLALLVVHEQFMTPTVRLADDVLPAAGWLEKPVLSTRMDRAIKSVPLRLP
jgi:anaerobic selenocysteine-containing dehydrogenase